MAKRKRPHGHYCKVCGEYKANEKFSGKGHAAHICKACARLPPEKQAEEMALNRLYNLPWQLSKEQRKWLENRRHDRRPEVREAAQEQYDMRFSHHEWQDDDFANEFDDEEAEVEDEFGDADSSGDEGNELYGFDVTDWGEYDLPF